jgi:hypothetical protein
MPLAAHFTITAGFQAASAFSAGELAAITRSAAHFQPTGAGHYCAGSLAAISAAIITSRSAVACTHEAIGGDIIGRNAAISHRRCPNPNFELPWLYPCF